MHVIAGGPKIAGPAAFNDDGFVAAAEDVAEKLLLVIESNGVGAQQPAHSSDQIGIRCFEDQVKMVAHEAVGVDFKTSLLAGFSQGFEEVLAIHLIEVDILLAISPAHDMVNGSGIFD